MTLPPWKRTAKRILPQFLALEKIISSIAPLQSPREERPFFYDFPYEDGGKRVSAHASLAPPCSTLPWRLVPQTLPETLLQKDILQTSNILSQMECSHSSFFFFRPTPSTQAGWRL